MEETNDLLVENVASPAYPFAGSNAALVPTSHSRGDPSSQEISSLDKKGHGPEKNLSICTSPNYVDARYRSNAA